jgi:transposase
MMVSLLLYGYCVGVPSSGKIERRTHENVAFRVIAGGGHPDHSSVSGFWRVHLAALADLFVHVLRLLSGGGIVKLGHVWLDGTKVKANASKHKAMSYDPDAKR